MAAKSHYEPHLGRGLWPMENPRTETILALESSVNTYSNNFYSGNGRACNSMKQLKMIRRISASPNGI
jgi:hypothetical protein